MFLLACFVFIYFDDWLIKKTRALLYIVFKFVMQQVWPQALHAHASALEEIEGNY